MERYGRGWRYRADVGIDPGTGKRRWAAKGGFASQKAARTALNKVLSAADEGTVVTRSSTLLADYLDEWMDGAESSLKQTTAFGYRRAIDKLKAWLGHVRLQDLTPLGIGRAYCRLIVSGLAAKSVRHSHTVLRRALSDAERLGLVSRNAAAAAAKAPAVVDKEQSTWAPAELNASIESWARVTAWSTTTSCLARFDNLSERPRSRRLGAGRDLSIERPLPLRPSRCANFICVPATSLLNRYRRIEPPGAT